MSEQYIGQILMFAGTFAMKGTAFCDGQIMPISQNTMLFSLLGTYYGGNGTSTYALPNLQGSVPVHQGEGSGLSPYVIGEAGGSQTVTLLSSQMPVHSHTFNASTANATNASPGGLMPAKPPAANASAYAVSQPPYPALVSATMSAQSCSVVGGSQPHNNMMPTLFISFLIVLSGVYPARN